MSVKKKTVRVNKYIVIYKKRPGNLTTVPAPVTKPMKDLNYNFLT